LKTSSGNANRRNSGRRDDEERRHYEDAVRQAIEEGRRLAQEKKVAGYLAGHQNLSPTPSSTRRSRK